MNETRKIYNHESGECWLVEPGSEAEAKLLAAGWSLNSKKGKKSEKLEDGDSAGAPGDVDPSSPPAPPSDSTGAPPSAPTVTKAKPGRKARAK